MDFARLDQAVGFAYAFMQQANRYRDGQINALPHAIDQLQEALAQLKGESDD